MLVTGYDNRAGQKYWIIKNVSQAGRACVLPGMHAARPALLDASPWGSASTVFKPDQNQLTRCLRCLQSWGTGWGSNGYGLLPMWSGDGQCAMNRVSSQGTSAGALPAGTHTCTCTLAHTA